MEDFSKRLMGDVLVLTVNMSRATIKEASELRKILDDEIVLKRLKVVVDLSQCSHIDSTFLGVLVVSLKKLSAKGGELKIVEPTDFAAGFMEVTGTKKIFNVYPSIDEAISSFNF